MNAVHGTIIENLRGIKIVYQETVEVFKNDKTNTSDSREITVQRFIESYLPSDFQVKERTKIYSKTQSTSNIDCVVLAPNHPRLFTPIRDVVIAEGVFSAIEVKPDIANKDEFLRGLKQIKSVKNIDRKVEIIDRGQLFGGKKRDGYFDKIPCVLFSAKSSDTTVTINFLRTQYQSGIIKFDELPDIVLCLDRCLIVFVPFFRDTTLYQNMLPNQKLMCSDKVFLVYESNDEAMLLSLFLDKFLKLPMPTILLFSHIIGDYLDGIIKDFGNQLATCRIVNLD